MKFWDSSALVPFFVQQPPSDDVRSLLAEDPEITVWTLSDLEVRSAVFRLARQGHLSQQVARDTLEEVETFWGSLHIVAAVDQTKLRAKRLLGIHALSAADGLQLAAACIACSDVTEGKAFVSLDERLRDAAAREGFRVQP